MTQGRRRKTGVAGVIAAATLLVLLSAAPVRASSRVWSLTNLFACTGSGQNQVCGPHNSMIHGGGNGTMVTGHILIQDGQSRIWVSNRVGSDQFGQSAWTLRLGGDSVVLGATWTVGVWSWSAGTFTPAAGAETVVAPGGSSSTFTPAASFSVPGNGAVALRLTGDSVSPAAGVVQVYMPLAQSPSFLSVAG